MVIGYRRQAGQQKSRHPPRRSVHGGEVFLGVHGMPLPDRHAPQHVFHHLLARHVRAVEHLRILRGPEGVGFTRGVTLIAASHIREHLLVGGGVPLGLQFLKPTARPHLGRGSQIDFQGGVGEHAGSDVAAIKQHALTLRQLLLAGDHGPAHLRARWKSRLRPC